MKKHIIFFLNVVLGFHVFSKTINQDTTKIISPILQNTKISGQWFLAYRYEEQDTVTYNRFLLRRTYLTIKSKLTKNLSARITQDMTLDEEGNDMGNIEIRLKYLYMSYSIPDFAFFSKPYFEIGLVHRPWLDFEEHINTYRVQGTMAMERFHLFNSAGLGVSFFTMIGQKMNNSFTKSVNNHYAGQYGSFSIGIYNGGGYHAMENNRSKNIEYRLSLRPFPSKLPGLQISYFGISGKGNIPEQPDFMLHNGFLSYENKRFTITGQYFSGVGNSSGTLLIDTLFNADEFVGYSAFTEVKIPEIKMATFFRYDHFETSHTNESKNIIIGGIAYKFTQKSKLILDFSSRNSGDNKSDFFIEVALEVHF
ncbi:MAG TPA: hypothetical protein EYP69_00980 [Bacteroidales bacterium]|nr:hypothetical protein [Bacteroidales bacterium]